MQQELTAEEYAKLNEQQRAMYEPSLAKGVADYGKNYALKKAGKYLINQIPGLSGTVATAAPTAISEGATGLGTLGSGTANTLALNAAGPTNVAASIEGAPAAASGSLASYALPAAAVLYGANALKTALYDKKELSLTQKLAMALPTMGLSLVPGIGKKVGGLFGDKDMWKTEGGRISKLREQGYGNLSTDAESLKKGRSKEELIAIEQAKINAGQPGNIKFAGSRNESDLTPQDISGYASVIEGAGKDATPADRLAFAEKALKAGAVREHHGTIDVDMSKITLGTDPTGKVVTTPAAPVVSKPLVFDKLTKGSVPNPMAMTLPNGLQSMTNMTPEEQAKLKEQSKNFIPY